MGLLRFLPNTVIDVNEEAVQSYIRPGGEVAGKLDDVAQTANVMNKGWAAAHARSGRLERGMTWNRAKLTGPLQGTSRIISSAAHTRYVNEGTAQDGAGFIYPAKKGWGAALFVPVNSRRGNHLYPKFKGAGAEIIGTKAKEAVFFTEKVKGQKGQHFLEENLKASLRSNGL